VISHKQELGELEVFLLFLERLVIDS